MVARAPRKRMYRSMQGRMIDIEKLRAANETIKAVGNMNVNARGDVIGQGGQVVKTKQEVVAKYYEQPKGKVSEAPAKKVIAPKKVAQAPQPKAVAIKAPAPKKVATPKVAPKKTTAPKKGIEAALDGLE
jgi:hypothetical protein|tara:strand:- start:330 stop:719 length:390 start_codon:yes stop_codon:yes gene_type:complete